MNARKALPLLALFVGAGCGTEDILGPASPDDASLQAPADPGGTVSVEWNGSTLTFWPYTGASFDGTAKDPVNVLLVGNADILSIRAALLSLDGDRTAYGLPPTYPFNATWSDAMGNLQVGWSEDGGWAGGVVQLQMGDYAPLRVHLRLFETRSPFGDGTWTVGAAHFEVAIPGTPEHQVLSWEIAEQIVTIDFLRSGLLAAPPQPTPVINAAPTWRDIPASIYNGLPPELQALIGPPGPVTDPVPIPTDGVATLLHLGGSMPVVAGTETQAFTMPFGQYVPNPLCPSGPLDWLWVEGPVDLRKTVEVDPDGRYEYRAEITGALTATPVDITQVPPVPIGDPYHAEITELQEGLMSPALSRARSLSERAAVPEAGRQLLREVLFVGPHRQEFESVTQCPGGV